MDLTPYGKEIIGIIAGIVGAVASFLFKDIQARLKKLEEGRTEDNLANARENVRKSDFLAFRSELLDTLHRFETNISERVYGLETRERDRDSNRKH